MVTETDQAVEKMVTETLLTAYPDFKFIGEETYKPGMKLTDAPTFIVDREYLHMPLFSFFIYIIAKARNNSY